MVGGEGVECGCNCATATLHVCISRLELPWQLRNKTSTSSSLRSLSSWRISNQLSSLFSFIIPGMKSWNACLANLTSAELTPIAFECFLQKPKQFDCAFFGGKQPQEMHVGQEVLCLSSLVDRLILYCFYMRVPHFYQGDEYSSSFTI